MFGDPISLEIGNGKYFDIVGNPEISDQLSQHGETMSCVIKVDRDAPTPKPGSLGFLVLNGEEKIFGGIMLTAPVQVLNQRDQMSVNFSSFALYAQRGQIRRYKKTAGLAGHIQTACTLAGVINLPLITKQLYNVFVIPDPNNDSPFDFEFQNGTLSQFLDSICSVKNCRWLTQDTGATKIVNLDTANANLIVQSNNIFIGNAPRTNLTVPEGSTSFDYNNVWWIKNSASYTYTPPIASVFWCIGHNGFNAIDNQFLATNEYLRYRAEEGRSSYPTLKTADKVLSIKVTT